MFILKIIFLFILCLNISTSYASNIKNSAVIFMYHKFGVDKYPSTSVTIDQFDAHIDELTNKKYSIKSLEFIIDTIINDGDLSENTIGISVDDADKSFYEQGWPKFKHNGIPVTLFVNTSTIQKNNKNYLNWDQIRELRDEGVSIGAHSHSHYHMSELSIEEVKKEIEISNNIFLKELGKIPPLFAFPYWEANKKIISLLKEYKFKVAFEWQVMKPSVLGSIIDHFNSDDVTVEKIENKLSENSLKSSEDDSDIVKQIKELLDTRVRPAVAMDGGDIIYNDFEDGIVYLKMQGACSGCPSSTATLKMGIENMLKHYIPEVQEVRPVDA